MLFQPACIAVNRPKYIAVYQLEYFECTNILRGWTSILFVNIRVINQLVNKSDAIVLLYFVFIIWSIYFLLVLALFLTASLRAVKTINAGID